MFLLLSSLSFAKTTEVDFDEVEITANRATPSISLIRETVRSLCPDEDNTSLAWQECVANLSYKEISTVCSSLGEKTPKVVNDLLLSSTPAEVYQNHSDGQVLQWQGCLYNSKTGSRVEDYVWIYAKNNWIMTDGKTKLAPIAGPNWISLTVFDKMEVSSNTTTIGDWFDVVGTFAYLLVPSVTTVGRYTGVLAKNNQNAINHTITLNGLTPPYCDEISDKKNCNHLPNMIVTAVTPWMMVVKTIMPDKFGYQVSGIFFQSVTGYDYTADGE
jgi:hypothetical protein